MPNRNNRIHNKICIKILKLNDRLEKKKAIKGVNNPVLFKDWYRLSNVYSGENICGYLKYSTFISHILNKRFKVHIIKGGAGGVTHKGQDLNNDLRWAYTLKIDF